MRLILTKQVIWGSGIGGMFTFFNESSNYALKRNPKV